MTRKLSTGRIGSDTTSSTILNYDAFPNYVKDRYLYKFNPQILMNWDNIKPFNTGIPDPSDPSDTTMLTQEYHVETPVTGYRLFTRDWTSFQMIKQDTAIDKKKLYTMPYWHGSSPTTIIMWYQSVIIHSATNGIYLHSN